MSLGICCAVMSVIAIMYLGVCSALKNIWSAKRRYAMWIVLFIGFLTPFKPHFGDPVYSVPAVSSASGVPSDGISEAFSGDITYIALFAVWLAGFLSSIAYFSVKQYRFYRYAERFSLPCSRQVLMAARAVCRELGVKDIAVLVLPGLPSPMLTGFFASTVLLPRDDYGEEELRLILKHELVHFKRRDLFIKLLVLLCRSVHWFNPLMPVFEKAADKVCELSCDERVLLGEGSEEKKIYCKAIISAVSSENLSAFSHKPAVAGSFGNGKLDLRYRLQLIVSSSAKKKLGALCVFLSCVTLFSGAVFGVSGAPYETGRDYLEESTFTSEEILSESHKAMQDDSDYEHSQPRETSTTAVFDDDPDMPVENLTGYSDENYGGYHEGSFTDANDLEGLVEKTTFGGG